MPTILFIQGVGEDVHDTWDVRLVASLEKHLGIAVRYPRMPGEAAPRYPDWRDALRAEFRALRDGDVLVGHSAGGAMLVHALAEAPPGVRPGALVLIAAPFFGKGGWPADDIPDLPDLGARLPGGMPVFLHHGTDDAEVPPDHAQLYAAAIPQALLRLHPGRDHQMNDDLEAIARDIRSVTSAS